MRTHGFAVYSQKICKLFARTRQSAHHSADRHFEDLGGFLVRQLLNANEKKDLALVFRQLVNGLQGASEQKPVLNGVRSDLTRQIERFVDIDRLSPHRVCA